MKAMWPCPLWALGWNAMWTPRRQPLEHCQGPLTLQRFLSFCPKLNNEWKPTASHPPPSPLNQDPPDSPTLHPPTSFRTHSVIQLNMFIIASAGKAAWRTITEEGKINERGVNFRTLIAMLPKILHSYIFQHPSGQLGGYGPVCVCVGPPSLGGVGETMGPVSYTKQL